MITRRRIRNLATSAALIGVMIAAGCRSPAEPDSGVADAGDVPAITAASDVELDPGSLGARYSIGFCRNCLQLTFINC